MTIWVACFRVYQDENENQVLESYEKWDASFDDAVEAFEYMNDKCGETTSSEAFLFYVDASKYYLEEK